jgi:hypothetical protein
VLSASTSKLKLHTPLSQRGAWMRSGWLRRLIIWISVSKFRCWFLALFQSLILLIACPTWSANGIWPMRKCPVIPVGEQSKRVLHIYFIVWYLRQKNTPEFLIPGWFRTSLKIKQTT